MHARIVIPSTEFDRLVSDLAAAIWNRLIEDPSFPSPELHFYADVFEAVQRSLDRYQQKDRKAKRK
jgi:hypothetical protein